MAKKRRRPHHPPLSNGARTATATKEQPRSTKAEHKELARRQREQERKRAARARFIRRYLTLVAVSGVAAVAVFLLMGRGRSTGGPLPGILTSPAPWSANTAQVGDRLDRLGLPAAGGALHIHADLQIYVDGTKQPVPTDIGLASGVESPLHTHDTSGVIHVESAEAGFRPSLGEFFDVWGVRLTSTCLGGYCDAGDRQLRAFVNGSQVTTNPRDIRLQDHDVIVLTFGVAKDQPKPIPSTYDWSTVNP